MDEALTALLLADPTVAGLTGDGDRIGWDVLGQGKGSASVALHLIDDLTDRHFGGPSGLVESRVQIDCRSTTRASARALARAIEALLDGYRGIVSGQRLVVFKISGRSGFDKTEAEGFYTVSADYQVWSAADGLPSGYAWLTDFELHRVSDFERNRLYGAI